MVCKAKWLLKSKIQAFQQRDQNQIRLHHTKHDSVTVTQESVKGKQLLFRLASTTLASVNKLITCFKVKEKGNRPGNYPVWFWMSASSDRDLRSPIVTTARRRSTAKRGIKRPTQAGEGLQSSGTRRPWKKIHYLKKKKKRIIKKGNQSKNSKGEKK